MIRWEHLDTAKTPDGAELRLMKRGTEFSIMLGNEALMTSRLSSSEEALATLAVERLNGRKRPHMLIGGLGMGFTLRAALEVLGPEAKITVAEIVPEVVTWARGPLAGVFGDCLDDPRVTIHVGDVGRLIGSSPEMFDTILLDVDNGPEGMTRPANEAIYQARGLGAAKAALKKGGILSVWSAHPDDEFTKRMSMAGFQVERKTVRAHAGKGARHTIWLGKK